LGTGHSVACIRDLVQDGTARHRLADRVVWRLAVVAILENELDAIVPSEEFDCYRRLFCAMRDGIDFGNEPVLARWTREVCLDRARFDQ
jgi:hypothetical protein